MEKYIIIRDCTKDELKTILNDWLVMYVEGLKSKLIFEIAEITPNVFILKMDKSIDDTHFFFLINYFAYPIDFKKTFEVAGYTTATKHKTLLNKKIYVFLNEQDTEYDNVWVTTEDNETYKFDFSGRFKKMNYENKYKSLDINSLSILYEQIIVNKKELLADAKIREEEKRKHNAAKRFKIIAPILFIGIPLAFLINNHFPYCPNDLLIFFCAIILASWFIHDYSIFYDIRRTVICVLLSLLSTFLATYTQNTFFTTLAILPLSSIIVMFVVNKFLGTKLVDILHNDKWNGLFFPVLLALSALISAFIFNPILKLLL
jgi:hypothetical protein